MRAIWPGTLLVGYLLATGMLLLSSAPAVAYAGIAAHFAVLLAIATVTWVPSAPPWLRAWAPLIVLLFLYAEMPVLIQAAGHREGFDATVIRWELAVFGTQPAIRWSQLLPSPVLSELLHLAYLTYYPIIYSVPAALWIMGRRRDFGVAAFAILLTFIACFACYIMFPVAGPRYLWTSTAPAGPFRSLATWLLEARSSRGTAFPSSHVAVAAAQCVLAVRFFGPRGSLLVVPTILLAAGAIYGGFHYALDVVAGALLGVITAMAGVWFMQSRAQANASAPT